MKQNVLGLFTVVLFLVLTPAAACAMTGSTDETTAGTSATTQTTDRASGVGSSSTEGSSNHITYNSGDKAFGSASGFLPVIIAAVLTVLGVIAIKLSKPGPPQFPEQTPEPMYRDQAH